MSAGTDSGLVPVAANSFDRLRLERFSLTRFRTTTSLDTGSDRAAEDAGVAHARNYVFGSLSSLSHSRSSP